MVAAAKLAEKKAPVVKKAPEARRFISTACDLWHPPACTPSLAPAILLHEIA